MIPVGMFKAALALAATIVFKNAVTHASNNLTSFTNTHAGSSRTGQCLVVVTGRKNSAGTNTEPTAVTLCGVSLTKILGSVNGRQCCSIWVGTTDITTDGTDNVVITIGTSNDKMTSVLYEIANVIEPTTVIDSAVVPTDSTPALDTDASAGCIMIAVGVNNVPTGFVWTGITENFDATVGSSAQRVSTASAEFATAGTKTISAVHGGSADNTCIVAAIR